MKYEQGINFTQVKEVLKNTDLNHEVRFQTFNLKSNKLKTKKTQDVFTYEERIVSEINQTLDNIHSSYEELFLQQNTCYMLEEIHSSMIGQTLSVVINTENGPEIQSFRIEYIHSNCSRLITIILEYIEANKHLEDTPGNIYSYQPQQVIKFKQYRTHYLMNLDKENLLNEELEELSELQENKYKGE